MMAKTDSVEILYVTWNSRDRRGRRVLVRENEVENVIWPPGPTAVDLEILGITEQQKGWMEKFLSGSPNV